MINFKFRKERLVTDAVTYIFHEFVDILEWDKTTDKRKANKMLYFVFLLCDLSEENPIRDVPYDHKEEEALFRAYGKKTHKFTKRELELVHPAVDTYLKYSKAAEERILEVFDDKAEEIRLVLEETKPETVENEKDGVVAFSTNTGIITKSLKELDYIKKQKINVMAAVKNEAMTQRVRGQLVLSPLSKGSISLTPEYELYAQYEADPI